jgi:hypothetical protein
MTPPDSTSRPRHEETDASPRMVVTLASTIVLLVALCIGAGIASIGGARSRQKGQPSTESFSLGPLYRTDIETSWAENRMEQEAHLSGYAWMDRSSGKVRIPIDRAMDLVVRESKGGKP